MKGMPHMENTLGASLLKDTCIVPGGGVKGGAGHGGRGAAGHQRQAAARSA